MADKQDAGVDPRFDPVFQRGYDPDRHPRRSVLRRPPMVEPAPTSPRSPVVEPVETAAPESGVSTGSTTGGSTVSTGSTIGVDDEYELPRRNPFRLILLLTSLASIAGAGALLWRRISTDPYGGYGGYGGDVGRIFVDQFMDALLAPLLTGGLLGICLWIALGALRRRDDG